jgi:hypothetical protein
MEERKWYIIKVWQNGGFILETDGLRCSSGHAALDQRDILSQYFKEEDGCVIEVYEVKETIKQII